MATTTTISLKAALITALQARAGLSGVTVSWGEWPLTDPARDWIMVGDITEPADQSAAALGQQRREEHYMLHIDCVVRRPYSDDPQTVATRAAALVAEIENELRDDCTVDDTVRVAQVVGVGLIEGLDRESSDRITVMPVRVDVRQRI